MILPINLMSFIYYLKIREDVNARAVPNFLYFEKTYFNFIFVYDFDF